MNADWTRPLLGHARERGLRALDVLDAVAVVAGEHLSESLAAHHAVLVAGRLADALVTIPIAIRNVLQFRLQI